MSSESGITDAVSSDARNVAQEQEQDRRDQKRAFDQVPEDGVRRAIDHLALIVERPNGDAAREHAPDLLEPRRARARPLRGRSSP